MGDLPPNPTHHPLPPNPTMGDTADRRSPARQMDPPGNERAGDPREDFPRGFTRGGFAPIPHRHSDAPVAASEPERQRSPPPPPRVYDRDFDRERDPPRRQEGRDREFPRRDLDPEPERGGRSWDTYYDRTGRGGPPPQWDDDYDRPKRRRSPSPYDQASRTRFRSPTPPRYPAAPATGLPDPAEVDYVLSFRQFSEWFRTSHPQTAKTDDEETRRVRSELENGAGGETGKEKVGMAKRYDRYRKEYTSRQLYGLFLAHGQTAWFQERYSHEPRFTAMRKRLCRQGRVPTVETYISELRAGKWDDVGYDMTDDTTKAGPSIRRLEDSQPEGLDRALGDFPAQDNSNRAEAPAQRGQIFVKTVPPSTKRTDLEEMFSQIKGFQHLAITEPSIKKQFYRVAWAQFTEETDLDDVLRKLNNTKIDTFTFHLGINTTPVIGRIRMTVPYASATDRVLRDTEKARALALKLEEELVDPETEEDRTPDTSLDKPVQALAERGSVVVEETISSLLEKHDLNGESLSEEQANVKAKLVLDQWLSYLRNGLSTCYYCVAPSAFPEELQRKCILHLRPQWTPENSDETTADHQDHKPSNGLDEDTDNRYEGGDREGVQANHGKTKTAFPQRTGDERWELSLDHKLEPLLGPVDVAEYGGRDIQEESKKVAAPHIRQEEATKYRCKECNKLFKAPEFVVKHVIVKHPELIGEKLDEIATLNNFVLDPQHIQPAAATPAAINDTLPISMLDPASTIHLNPAMANGDMSGGNAMMQQQMMMMLQMQQAMMMGQMQFPQQPMGQQGAGMDGAGLGQGGQDLLQRVGGYASRDANLGPLPAAPAGGEDPRAKRGRVSYQDLDQPGGAGDGGLPY